jgi:EmrB/QacA subfamily drug resistance transporter
MSPPALDPRRWFALALLALSEFVVVLDASIVNIALPSIGRGLHFSLANLSWVVNAYVLTFGGFLLLGGRIADLVGRRRVFVVGLGVFSLASLAGGLAESEAWLIGARAAQGLGAAMLAPAALSLVTATFAEGTERNKALSIWGAVAGSGAAAGVLLGGVLTSALGWRSVLFVNVPIGIAAILIAPRLLSESKGGVARGFDLPGAALVTAGLSALVYALVRAASVGWGSTQTIGIIAAAAVLLIAFVDVERRSATPLVPFSFFRNRNVTLANAAMLAAGAAIIGLFYYLSLYLQRVLGYSAIKAGTSLLPLAVGTIVAAGLASPLIARAGIRKVLRRWPRVVRAAAGPWHIPRGRARPVAVDRARTWDRVRGDHDPVGQRRQRPRVWTGEWLGQHLPADRWRPRTGRPLVNRDHEDRPPRRHRPPAQSGAHARVPHRVPRRRRLRAARDHRHRDDRNSAS